MGDEFMHINGCLNVGLVHGSDYFVFLPEIPFYGDLGSMKFQKVLPTVD